MSSEVATEVVDRVRMVATGFERDLELVRGESAPPQPTGDQLVVEIEAAGVCYRDLIDREGRIPYMQLPVTPGHEGVGRVVAVGPDARDFAEGARVGTMHRDACGCCDACERGETSLCRIAAHVLGLIADGTYARYLVAPERVFYAVPDDLDPALGAILHCTFGTAWRSLVTAGGLRRGERVLITGANGGVGSAAVQIAARFASEVVAVVRRSGHEAYLRKLGATSVIVDCDGTFHKKDGGFDLVLDNVGAATFNASLRSLGVGGRLAVVGNVTNERAEINLGYLIVNGLRVIGPGGATRRDMAALLEEHCRKPFLAPIEATLALSEADRAQRRLREGGLRGRIVLVPEP